MAKVTPLSESEAHQRLCRAHGEGRIAFFTDRGVLARPGSPVYSALDVFVPPLVLMASSLTLLFAFGLLEWIIALVLVLLYQAFVAPHLVHWRLHRRAVAAILRHPHNLKLLWESGGLVLALKDWPERNCRGPFDDWRAFVRQYLDVPEAS